MRSRPDAQETSHFLWSEKLGPLRRGRCDREGYLANTITRPVIIVEPILPYDRANAYRGCT